MSSEGISGCSERDMVGAFGTDNGVMRRVHF